ncbi:hypothetical protein [Mucilaginibacter rubeus]|uniref:Uncharacterized protein n=1 Tax=Mucilaginibacter rubeus TaxID=2027860 RepID=A0A5C1I840_9SPHI|nr:hypothetical protein [Mucilaginibacter rubeus]QEM13540.1 hypothetical protein DEO27_027180 [Mucilaginibacter rubeus]
MNIALSFGRLNERIMKLALETARSQESGTKKETETRSQYLRTKKETEARNQDSRTKKEAEARSQDSRAKKENSENKKAPTE